MTTPTPTPPSRPVHMPVTAEPVRWVAAAEYVARWRERQEGA